MKILILTFYYPPDLSAGAFRARALVAALLDAGNKDLQVDVLTAMPNRYHSIALGAPTCVETERLKIRRVPVPRHKSGMLDQAKAFAVFARNVLRTTREEQWDIVFATSSRLMTAALGAKVARQQGAPLYLDIRDLFTDTMGDLLGRGPSRLVLPVLRIVERWTLRSAAKVNLVSAGFLPFVEKIVSKHDYRIFTNGIDDEFLQWSSQAKAFERSSLPLILYAGNIGEGQGLHHILPDAAWMLEGSAYFRLIGGGGRRNRLASMLEAKGVSNVEMINPMPRSSLYGHYMESDILLLHLNDHAAFRRVLPSKVFEYAASGKPILAGVSGYAAEFLAEEVEGAEIFAPCDADGMVAACNKLLAGPKWIDRSEFCRKFGRRSIMREMARDLLDLAVRA